MSGLDAAALEAFGLSLAETLKQAMASEISPLLARIAELENQLSHFKSVDFPFALEETISKQVLNVAGIKLALDSVGGIVLQIEELGPLAGRIKGLEERIESVEALEPPAVRLEEFLDKRLQVLDSAVKELGEAFASGGEELEKTVAAQGVQLAGIVEAQAEIEPRLLDVVKTSVASSVAESVAGIATIKGDKGDTGADVVSAFIDREGCLILTCADGTAKNVGKIVGKDGDPGLGFDDLDIELVGARTLSFVWTRGEQRKEREFVIPWILDSGVYSEGEEYQKGDGVTFGGALWVAQKDTTAKPGSDDTWRLAVKKGRDGRDLRLEGGK